GFSVWNTLGAVPMVGDFDGNGTADVAFRKSGWGSTPTYFSHSDGTFTFTNVPDAGGFWNLARDQEILGDYNRHGRMDVAFRANGWGSIPVYMSNGDGSFSVLNIGHGNSWIWNSDPAATAKMVGDFNGDGKTDVAFRHPGWGTMPIFFSNGNGSFTI